MRHFEGGKQCAVLLRRGKRQNWRGFCDPAETARIQRSVIIEDYMKTKDNLLDFLKAFAAEHPEVNIHTILPREENIKKVLAALSQIEEKAQSVFTGEADI